MNADLPEMSLNPTQMDSVVRGVFHSLSFAKHIFPRYSNEHWDTMEAVGRLGPMELYGLSMAVFHGFDEAGKRDYIHQLATDLHETHHFHCFAFLPAGQVLFSLYSSLVTQSISVLRSIGENLVQGADPLRGMPKLGVSESLLKMLNYYLGASLPEGRLDGKIGAAPFLHTFEFPGKTRPCQMPVFEDTANLRPIGWLGISESWTWSLMKALVYRQFPHKYYEWYARTKDHEDLWMYHLLARIFRAIFGDAYESLDPVSQHSLIAVLSVSACTLDPTPKDDFLQQRGTHPGWLLASLVDFVWEHRGDLVENGRVQVERFTRVVRRLRCIDKKHDVFSLPDHFLRTWRLLSDTDTDTKSLLSFVHRQLLRTRAELLCLYFTNNSVFLDAAEWLTCTTHNSILPRIPIAIGKRPDSESYHMAFPRGEDNDSWFSWYLLSQTVLSLLTGEKQCPLHAQGIDMGCPQDPDCTLSTRLLRKSGKCHLRALLVGRENGEDHAAPGESSDA